MKINEKISARVCASDEPITSLQTGAYETWHNGWECLGLHSELKGKTLTLQVKVSQEVLGGDFRGNFAGVVVFTKDWPASRGGQETWVKPEQFKAQEDGVVFYSKAGWKGNYTDSAANNICVVEVCNNVFKTHEFCVVSDGEYVFLVYNMTYHGQMFKRGGELFVPDLQRKNIVSRGILQALQARVNPDKLPQYDDKYQCWAEMIDYTQLEANEAVVIAMATPIGSFYLRDKDCRHITATIRQIHGASGECPFPTVGLVCHGSFSNTDQRPVMNDIEFYGDSENRYSQMILAGEGGAVIPDMGVPEEKLIIQGRRPRSQRVARKHQMKLPPIDPGVLELGRLAFGK